MSQEIEDIILEAISFFDPLTKDKIILDLNEYKITVVNEFSLQDFEDCFVKLLSDNKIKAVQVGSDTAYLRVFPKRKSWLIRQIKKILKLKHGRD